jgi:hypothetical protein
MDFALDEEQEQLRASIIAFARDRLDDRPSPSPDPDLARDQLRRCAEVGLTGLTVSPELGGEGADALTAVIALEALGYACGDNGLAFSLGAQLFSVVAPLERFGSAEQKDRYLRAVVAGDRIGAHAMSEPDSGSDAFSLRTRARREGDAWVLTGSKSFITNGPIADFFVTFATTDPSKGWGGLCCFLVDAGLPGLEVSGPVDKMGLGTSPMAEVALDDCRVADDALLGRAGSGMAVFMHSMDWERGCILAPAVGAMQRQVEQARDYARTREQFGQPIGHFQVVANRIVDMAVRAEAARLLLYKMAWRKSQGERADVEASMVKLFVSEGWTQSSIDQLLVHGGAGYLTETGVERDVRDAIASQIYSGTNDIQRNLIARSLKLT